MGLHLCCLPWGFVLALFIIPLINLPFALIVAIPAIEYPTVGIESTDNTV